MRYIELPSEANPDGVKADDPIVFHDTRHTFGTLLAAAHLLLGDEGMDAAALPWEKLDHWGIKLSAEAAAETADRQPNWARCLDELLSAPMDAFNKGERQTIGQLLEALEDDRPDSYLTYGSARQRLASCDIGLLARGLVGEGYGLGVPVWSRGVAKLFQDTQYAARGGNGAWSTALRQGPPEIIRAKAQLRAGRQPDNRMTIGGRQVRVTFVSLADLKRWQEGEDG
jgi:hypothetical protein